MNEEPKLWKNMTPEEKGALLLAHYEKRVIEYFSECDEEWVVCLPRWMDHTAYRVRPEPKVEAVKLGGGYTKGMGFVFCSIHPSDVTHRITFNLVDGIPDCSSIKMGKM